MTSRGLKLGLKLEFSLLTYVKVYLPLDSQV